MSSESDLKRQSFTLFEDHRSNNKKKNNNNKVNSDEESVPAPKSN